MNRPLREIEPATAEPKAPHVFVRAVSAPPGWPWEQARAARLEAEHGAPLPLSELMHQVRRLAPWGLGKPGRFGVFYLRRQEYRSPFETLVDVDGQAVKVAFGTPAGRLRRLQGAGVAVGLCVAAGAVLGTGVALALGIRSEATARLEAVEQRAEARLRAAQAAKARADRVRDLEGLVAGGRPLESVLDDLSWVALSKTPEARLMGIHWERGLLAVEARGETAPFLSADRPLERAATPIRPGVWLWAVGASGRGERSGGPLTAEVKP